MDDDDPTEGLPTRSADPPPPVWLMVVVSAIILIGVVGYIGLLVR